MTENLNNSYLRFLWSDEIKLFKYRDLVGPCLFTVLIKRTIMKQKSRLQTRGNYAYPDLEKYYVSILVIWSLKLVSLRPPRPPGPRHLIYSNQMREWMYVFFNLLKNFSLEARSEKLISWEIAALVEEWKSELTILPNNPT